MKIKLASCMLSLLLGTIITTNANAFVCQAFNDKIKQGCDALCNRIPDTNFGLTVVKAICL
ncbi:hypothetical protein WDV76_11250 [Xenorhabdus griffiniae]|uniref:hypothetical protein n=1 Tax=Xenorhabdus griffiniae TaxID=351672 RepID=UPI0030D60E1E